MSSSRVDPALLDAASGAVGAARLYVETARAICSAAVSEQGVLNPTLMEAQQRRVHGLAWTATLVEGLEQLVSWASRAPHDQESGEVDALVLHIGLGEYLAQIAGGLPMSQCEIVRPADLGACAAGARMCADPAVRQFLDFGNTAKNRAALAQLLAEGRHPSESLGDETLDMMREQTRRFSQQSIAPNAHAWHLKNALIPDEVIAQMAALGIFALCIPTTHGGLGLGKLAMCVVSEELSRGWLGAGSLGTRSEIAGELIAAHGTPQQQALWLPGIACGSVLPTAVFTEPDCGSDLASLTTRARRGAEGTWLISGSKTWITHAARSDLMTVLARTDPRSRDHGGLSMFLAPKSRRDARSDFPDAAVSGSEIEVLGYRGMREYALAFDEFVVAKEGLLGDAEGAGFRQLMSCFEGARIQTAARAVGVARNALDLACSYACERRQFGKALIGFPRISDKLALMAVETVIARELTHFAARTKDEGVRCDIAAGMAKLLAARVAWSSADAALQIHGGNGYALEYEISRVLCDARILSIFEGAAEIQANIIGRGLLGRR